MAGSLSLVSKIDSHNCGRSYVLVMVEESHVVSTVKKLSTRLLEFGGFCFISSITDCYLARLMLPIG